MPSRRVEMNRMPKDAINPKAALHELPPLLKGYLRLGAFVGDGAVVDHQFGTTDVLVVMPVSASTPATSSILAPTRRATRRESYSRRSDTVSIT